MNGFASLSSGLLARKGAAKPAMRPQGFGHMTAAGLEDLGWNDMGHGGAPLPAEAPLEGAPAQHVPSSISALTPAPRGPRPEEALSETPPVVEQQRAIAQNFEQEEEEEEAPAQAPAPAPVPAPVRRARKAKADVVALPRRPKAAASGRKAAFTLRLDSDRHIRLRLASAVTGRSAQQIVAGALDDFLAGLPEVEALATRVPAVGAKRS